MEARRFAFRLFYLGGNYHGISYQPSPDIPTIIKVVYDGLFKTDYITSPKENAVQYAGRTDKGVNSLANTVAFTTHKPEFRESLLNDTLPEDMCVWASAEVPIDFNPRSWAVSREYRYFLPRYGENQNLNLDAIQAVIPLFLGKHDYKNFSKPDAGKPTQSSISAIHFFETDQYYEFRFEAKSFLWMQVRKITRALRNVGAGEFDAALITKWLDPQEPASIQPMDAEYLVLWDVKYPDNIQFRIREGYLKRIWYNLNKERENIERKSRGIAGFLTFKNSLLA
ncbi:MAG: tRNA pseudouridine synthase A [Promethearchaeota archaeon CR_4]|nr:MAG: tRNA pseudouridine synthase A [Candidatus Lokiarchaeota archaeon CR_4]